MDNRLLNIEVANWHVSQRKMQAFSQTISIDKYELYPFIEGI